MSPSTQLPTTDILTVSFSEIIRYTEDRYVIWTTLESLEYYAICTRIDLCTTQTHNRIIDKLTTIHVTLNIPTALMQ